MIAKGSFSVTLEPQDSDVCPAGRLVINKEYQGDLTGSGKGQMISKRTEAGVSVYSAIEEVTAILAGKQGSFTLFHTGLMSSEESSLTVIIVDGSGAGELVGITGSCTIEMVDGGHFYTLNYTV